MSENTPQQPGDPQEPPHQPPQQPPPARPGPAHGQPPAGPPPHGGQPPYGDQPYAPAQQPYEGQMPDPGLYGGFEYPPDRSAGPHMPGGGQGSGFLSAMFDYSFGRYITPSVVKVVYIIVTVLVAIAWLGGIVAAFQASVWAGILYLVFGWIIALVYLAIARITLEFFMAVISVSERVNAYAKRDGII
ncbi:DUF4282 domain-containing protein [Isoptericola sp. NPDC057653]|uniref:DUF4282 domain-containing protein n=1 Tax=unclassified Isoptericola TaxID=2623355 RepID=UPI003692C1CB